MPSMDWSTGPGDSTLEGWQKQTYEQNQGIGKAGKFYKNILKKIGSGDDVSSMPFLQTLRDTFANQRAAIDDSYLTGGNKLLAENGGEDALLLNRMHQYETDKQSQQEGQSSAAAEAQLTDVAGRGFQTAYDSAGNRELQQQGMAMNNRLGYDEYRNRPYQTKSLWDKFMDVGNMLTGAGATAAKLGYQPGGG